MRFKLNKFEPDSGLGPWVEGSRGQGPIQRGIGICTGAPLPEQNDRHYWKHHLPATSLTSGKYLCSVHYVRLHVAAIPLQFPDDRQVSKSPTGSSIAIITCSSKLCTHTVHSVHVMNTISSVVYSAIWKGWKRWTGYYKSFTKCHF